MNLPENRTIDNSASGPRIEIEGGFVGYYPQRRALHACKRDDFFASVAGAISLPPATIVAGFL
jgi:hypothetical protein